MFKSESAKTPVMQQTIWAVSGQRIVPLSPFFLFVLQHKAAEFEL
jgi:hypothetical protein